MTTFKEFVERYHLEPQQVETLWLHLLMHRLANWREGLAVALDAQKEQK